MVMDVKIISDGRRRPLQVPTVIQWKDGIIQPKKITVGLLLVYGHYDTISRTMIVYATSHMI
jgi:hypothetical protein